MSDLMLLGVLRMPMDDAGPLEVFQYVARGRQAADEIERLRAERDAAFAMSKCQCGTEEACANLAKLRAEVAGLREDAVSLRAERDNARADRDALREDADRYLYLRDEAWRGGSLIFYAERYGPEDWDEQIDAALAARKGEA